MILRLFNRIKLRYGQKHFCPRGQAGQSLFEIVIAVALVGLILGLGTALISAALQSAEKARVQATASRLIQELMESASAVAGSSWHKIYCPPAGEGSGTCADSGHKGEVGSPNKFYATSTLMGYWPMDELSGTAVADTSGFGNNGTASRADTIVDGYAYKARQFISSSNDYVSLPNITSVSATGTYEFWVKPSSINAAEGWIDDTNNFDIFQWTGSLVYFRTGGNQSSVSIAGWSPNTWHHVAMTWNGANYYGYLDGVQVTSGVQSGSRGGTISVGRVDGGYYFNGIIDEARIFNRALPQYEIQQHYLKAKDVLSKTPVSGTESLVFGNNIYTRWFTVENVSRVLGDQSIESTYESTRDDPSTQKITVSATAQRFLATTSIVQYITRSKNEAYRQIDWSCGVVGESPSPDNPCGYSSASSTIIIGGSLELDTLSE